MNSQKTIEWVLRVAISGEFLGHGIFALQGKKAWIEWFSNFGISNPVLGGKLLFLVGLMDIFLALMVLIKPIKALILWMAIWGFWTALLRPIVGEPIWDFIERWANWGAPLALFLIKKSSH